MSRPINYLRSDFEIRERRKLGKANCNQQFKENYLGQNSKVEREAITRAMGECA